MDGIDSKLCFIVKIFLLFKNFFYGGKKKMA